jgi:aspartyl-tRNA(Asn)/glutamyl-tRNA(Gln) amidotransferase subunit A
MRFALEERRRDVSLAVLAATRSFEDELAVRFGSCHASEGRPVNVTELRSVIDDPEARARANAVLVLDAFLDRIDLWQPHVNAFITVTPDLARADAIRADEARANGRSLAPLDGMMVAVKDDIDVAGVVCTVGSPIRAHVVADEDAEVVRRLRAAGAVIVGKVGLHEWAYGATSNNPHFGTIRNPWDLDRIPGGSSGGSATAVAADLCIGALGSDAGGSVRVPAALTGVTGFRPTLGSVSSRGSHPICFSIETIGPIARSARDAAVLFSVISGYDRDDPHSLRAPVEDKVVDLDEGIAGIRVGVVGGYFLDGVDPDIATSVRHVADELAALGASVGDLVLPSAESAYEATCLTILRAEALAIHEERLALHPDLYGDDVRHRLELGREVSGVDFARATETVRRWQAEVREAFEQVELLVVPTTPEVAPPIESAEMIPTTQRLTRMAFPLSAAGVPAISLPCGFTDGSLPMGVQIAAAPWQDSLVLRAGVAYQEQTDWHRRRPAEISPGERRIGQSQELAAGIDP